MKRYLQIQQALIAQRYTGPDTPVLTLRQTCDKLGYGPGKVGLLSDVHNGRWDHVSRGALLDLRHRLGLPAEHKVYWRLPLPVEWQDWLTADQARAILAEHIPVPADDDVLSDYERE